MYSVGQADNLLTAGSVSMPKYDNESLDKSQYPCMYSKVDMSKRPEQIPLGSYDNSKIAYPLNEYELAEPYVKNTQHKKAGEIEDIHILAISLILLVLIIAGWLMLFK